MLSYLNTFGRIETLDIDNELGLKTEWPKNLLELWETELYFTCIRNFVVACNNTTYTGTEYAPHELMFGKKNHSNFTLPFSLQEDPPEIITYQCIYGKGILTINMHKRFVENEGKHNNNRKVDKSKIEMINNF